MTDPVFEKALHTVREAFPGAIPQCGLILGSGWSEVAEAFEIEATLPYEKIPGLGRTGVVGHAGRLCLCSSSGVQTLVFQGRRHYYEGEGWSPIALPVFILKEMGVSMVVLTNAAGGVREDLKPGNLMIIEDHINNMKTNPLIGPHEPVWGARFPDQSNVYDARLRERLAAAGERAGESLASGVYFASIGPTYETPAEIRAYRTLGADAVGMSTIPEAILASATGMRVAALSCITNYAAGIQPEALSHEEVTDTTQQTMPRMKSVLVEFWKEIADELANT